MFITIIAMSLLLVGQASTANALNLLVNGSFESPGAPAASFLTQIPNGWTSLGNGSTVDIIAAGYAGGSASDGNQLVDLIGGGVGTFPSGLKQTVTLQGGTMYSLSFDYNGGRYQDGTPTSGAVLDYLLGSLVSGSVNVDALNAFASNGPVTPWQSMSLVFTVATTNDYLLTFQTLSGAFGGPYIDDVRLNVIPVNVPEPSTLMLLVVGLAGLAVVRLRETDEPMSV